MIKVLAVLPIAAYANGGISSWSRKFVKTFPDDKYQLITINQAPRRPNVEVGVMGRILSGLKELRYVLADAKQVLRCENIKLMHTTTSGSLGSLRDYLLARLCKKYGVKTILHCRYGCIPEDFAAKNLVGWLLRKTLYMYDQVWVLDSRSAKALKQDARLRDHVFLTPNSIEVTVPYDDTPKTYKHIGFIGNLIPSKGLFELVEAVVRSSDDTILSIVGPGENSVVERIGQIAGPLLNKRVRILGKMSNDEAVEFMRTVDIVALPTYYRSEAFPISILEAMRGSKMVISTPRAAIQDMLTAVDGTQCGCLVREQSVEDIVEAIVWCQNNTLEADEMCLKAYKKVYTSYRTEVIYDLYRSLYEKIMER